MEVDADCLFWISLYGADVPPSITRLQSGDGEGPVGRILSLDIEPGVTTECLVPHCQQVNRVIMMVSPGDYSFLQKIINRSIELS